MMYDYYPDHIFGYGILGLILMILFWVLVIALLFRLFRGPRHRYDRRRDDWDDRDRPMDHSVRESALNILKERYAKGELTKEQFESMRKDIE